MEGRTSRRRVLAGTAALAVAAALPPVVRVSGGAAQATTPQAALERLFSADQVDPSWFSPTVLQQVSLPELQAVVDGEKGLFGAYQAVRAANDGSFLVVFAGGAIQVRVALDDQGRITRLGILGVSYALAGDEQEVPFQSGSDTLYGTLLLPAGIVNPPAALLIAGSGPTDRNGNSPLTTARPNTLANIARTLADAGVASLRYDKFGAGKTGTAGHAPDDIDFSAIIDEAIAAYAALAARAEVDGTRLLLAGHSEGGQLALLVARQLQATAAPTALVLAAPLGQRALDVLRRQLVAQVDAALAAGEVSQAGYDAFIADLDRAIASIRADGTIPPDVFRDDPQVPGGRGLDLRTAIFTPSNNRFLQQSDRIDPAQVAAALPAALPVLMLHGALDANVDEDDIQHLLAGFQAGGNTGVQVAEFPDVNHTLQQVVAGQPRAFSPDVAATIAAFVARVFS